MARVWQAGFEAGKLEAYLDNVGGALLRTSGPAPRNGTYCMQGDGWPLFDTRNCYINLPSAIGECYFRMGLWCGSQAIQPLMSFYDLSAPGFQAGVLMSSLGFMQVQRGDGTVLATAGTALTVSNWHLFEFHYKCDGSVGVFDVKIDGATTGMGLTFSGNTKLQTATTFGRIYFGGGASSMVCGFDDMALNDTTGSRNNSWIGEGKSIAIVPNANGDVTGLGGTVGSATHYQNVDDIPPNDATDYNYDAAAVGTNNYDLYNLVDPGNVGSVNAIRTFVRAQKDDAGAGNFRFVHKIGGTEYRDAADIALTQSWFYYSQIREVNPNSGAAWTATDLNNLQAGFDAR